MKRFSLILLICFLFSLFTASVNAEIRITQAKLNAQKINIAKFGIVNISDNGKVVTAYEKLSDLKLKQKGQVYKLWIFEFTTDKREGVKISEVILPCTMLQNAALSPDGKTSIVTAERGSKFIKVDIPTKKATVLFEHKKGIPGFRCDSGIIQYYDSNRVGAVGYFYDEKDRVVNRATALIDPTKKGNAIFKLGFNSTVFEYKVGDKSKYIEWYDADKCFFVGKFKSKGKSEEQGEWLCHMNNGKIEKLVKADMFLSLACGKGVIVYTSAKDNPNKKAGQLKYTQPETFVYDLSVGKPVKISPTNDMYGYIATSKDGRAAIISQYDMRNQKVSYFYGNKANGFKMAPIPELQKTPMSQMRLCYSGSAYVTWDGSQIIWGKFNKPANKPAKK